MTISHVIYLEFARLIVSQQWVTEVDRTEVLGEEMIGYQDDINAIRQHNKFFQLKWPPDHTTSPSFSNISLNTTVYICNFKGWSACLMTDASLIKDYADRYHFCIELDTCGSYITIWRWKPRRSGVISDQRAGHWGTGASREACRGD